MDSLDQSLVFPRLARFLPHCDLALRCQSVCQSSTLYLALSLLTDLENTVLTLYPSTSQYLAFFGCLLLVPDLAHLHHAY